MARSRKNPSLPIALDPSSPPEALAQLAQSRSPAVRRAVAANPNTPSALLFRLLGTYPEAVLGNPVWLLLTLETPDWISPLPPATRLAVARSPACPEELLRWALGAEASPALVLALLTNEGLPREARRRFLCERWGEERALGARWAEARPALQQALGRDFVGLLRRAGFGWDDRPAPPDPELTEDDLRRLAGWGRLGWRLALGHPAVPPELVAEACAAEDPHVRALAARRADLPRTLAPGLARDASAGVRQSLAQRSPEPGALALLATAADDALAKSLVLNPRTRAAVGDCLRQSPPEAPVDLHPLLLRLAHRDPDPAVRAAVARHPRADPDVLGALARDPSPAVRAAARQNPAR